LQETLVIGLAEFIGRASRRRQRSADANDCHAANDRSFPVDASPGLCKGNNRLRPVAVAAYTVHGPAELSHFVKHFCQLAAAAEMRDIAGKQHCVGGFEIGDN